MKRGGDAESVRARLATLEAAARPLAQLPVGERVAGVGRVLAAVADPGSPVGRRLRASHPPASGLSPANVAAGLDLAFSAWQPRDLERLVARELPEGAGAEGVTAVVHGGVIPMPTLLDALLPLVAGSPVLSKPAARDPVTPHVIAEALEDHAAALAGAFALAPVHRDDETALGAMLSARRVLVTGGDAAVAAIRSRAGPETRVIAHGHKLSVAVLGERADPDEAADGLAVDVGLWDQLGCLSPVACWCVGDGGRARAFAAALARALEARERVALRGEVEPAAAAQTASERAGAELRAAAGHDVALHAGAAWTVVAEADPAPRPAPLFRFVRVHPIAGLDALPAALAPIAPFVAGVAHAGLDEAAARRVAAGLGASRTAPFGRLQAPPLDWARDALGPLASLLDPAPGS